MPSYTEFDALKHIASNKTQNPKIANLICYYDLEVYVFYNSCVYNSISNMMNKINKIRNHLIPNLML